MIPTRSLRLATISLVCLVALPASSALGATKKKKSPAPVRPTVTSVAPLTLAVGDMLTIRGNNFVVGRKRNTVLFKSDRGPAVSVSADEATKTRMKVIVPASLEKHFATGDGGPVATRFRIRILSKRFGKSFTSNAMSPLIGPANVVTGDAKTAPAAGTGPGSTAASAGTPTPTTAPAPPPDCDADGVIDSLDGDDDNDRLSDVLEVTIKTDPCKKDTDFDGSEDPWEYYSALDLNQNPSFPATPYPAKRPYPNPLDGTDANKDFDGDGMRSSEEHALWQKFGGPSLPLNYSDGTQFTGPPVAAPVDSAHIHLNILFFRDSQRDLDELSDDEKDADGDRLGNWDETHGRLNPGFWPANHPTEIQFSPFYLHMGTPIYQQPNYLDPDSDGDGILDGDDDQDHDDRNNVDELNRGPVMVHPFNPCLPDYRSRTCPRYFVAGEPIYAPFEGTTLPPNPVPWPLP